MRSRSVRWKDQLHGLLFANLALVGTLLASFAGAVALHSFSKSPIVLNTVPLLLGALGVTLVAVAVYPAATWRSLGLSRANFPDGLWGLLLGAAGSGLLVGLAVLAEWASWTPIDPSEVRFDWRDARLVGVALLTIGALGEELFLRGLILQFLARSLGRIAAVTVTALVFALLHGSNPGVTGIAQLNTALYGMLFGLAVLRQRSLWLAVGLHLGWNLAQVALGVNNSGITIRLTELNLESRTAAWLAGGDYGLEGGVLATGMALVLAAAVWRLPARKNPPRMLWETRQQEDFEASGSAPGVARDLPADDRVADGYSEDREADCDAAR